MGWRFFTSGGEILHRVERFYIGWRDFVVPEKLEGKNLNSKKVKFKNETEKKESRNSKRNYHSFVTT